jgi:hypothetical protein
MFPISLLCAALLAVCDTAPIHPVAASPVIARESAVRVPVTVWVIRGPYEMVRQEMAAQMDSARTIWGAAGIDLADVRWVDATGHPAAPRFQGSTSACGEETSVVGFDAGRTNVYVSGPVARAGALYGGYTCGPAHINMSATALDAPALLAHELGHSFGLLHEAGENLMNPSALHRTLTRGQVLRARLRHASIPTRTAGPASTGLRD